MSDNEIRDCTDGRSTDDIFETTEFLPITLSGVTPLFRDEMGCLATDSADLFDILFIERRRSEMSSAQDFMDLFLAEVSDICDPVIEFL
jgi:hypothetical protein